MTVLGHSCRPSGCNSTTFLRRNPIGAQYAESFADVEHVQSTWDKWRNPFDPLLRASQRETCKPGELLQVASHGDNALMGSSLFRGPIDKWPGSNPPHWRIEIGESRKRPF
jgi:hypothetical protein